MDFLFITKKFYVNYNIKINIIVTTVTGFVVPIVLKRLKIDPALASSIFVTTFTDVLGFFFFLGLATMFIQYLI